MRAKPVIKGLLTYIPGAKGLLPKGKTGGSDRASYCYAVWLKHLVLLNANGYEGVPNYLAELGPGDSLGFGLCAILSGTDVYYALDVIEFSNTESNLQIFNELVEMFQARAGNPIDGWPPFNEHLDEQLFPSNILTEQLLAESLSESRLMSIENAIKNPGVPQNGILISYMVPWSDPSVINEGSVDAILSHSVLEHVVDVDQVYDAMHRWLKPGGVMSHQIDFKCHGLTEEWNGFWSCPEWLWRLTVGKREWLINRMPVSAHLDLAEKLNFKIICCLKNNRLDGLERSQLSKKWKKMSEDDLRCSGVFLQARKQ